MVRGLFHLSKIKRSQPVGSSYGIYVQSKIMR
ncbi:hypothetical protein PS691_02555 [Pseudomonas fluorescens]|uniref:Uncharacterized protein n=1 Tax=Pseudomonas fluorescens TaxID=294 RepID=A0A5E7C5W9_PSEFL|nr:hypothetical protein PS691_02555 [Pseudomonas fluorescens]